MSSVDWLFNSSQLHMHWANVPRLVSICFMFIIVLHRFHLITAMCPVDLELLLLSLFPLFWLSLSLSWLLALLLSGTLSLSLPHWCSWIHCCCLPLDICLHSDLSCHTWNTWYCCGAFHCSQELPAQILPFSSYLVLELFPFVGLIRWNWGLVVCQHLKSVL